jgi:hypothetical protein
MKPIQNRSSQAIKVSDVFRFCEGQKDPRNKWKKQPHSTYISTCHALVNAEGDTLFHCFWRSTYGMNSAPNPIRATVERRSIGSASLWKEL